MSDLDASSLAVVASSPRLAVPFSRAGISHSALFLTLCFLQITGSWLLSMCLFYPFRQWLQMRRLSKVESSQQILVPDHPRQQSLSELWRCLADMKQSFTEMMSLLPTRTIEIIETIGTFI
jgi:hypothetical protein